MIITSSCAMLLGEDTLDGTIFEDSPNFCFVTTSPRGFDTTGSNDFAVEALFLNEDDGLNFFSAPLARQLPADVPGSVALCSFRGTVPNAFVLCRFCGGLGVAHNFKH